MEITKLFMVTVVVIFTLFTKESHACGATKTTPPPPPPPTDNTNRCTEHKQCGTHEQCLLATCTNICDFDLIPHALNAVCTSRDHVPYYSCPEEYEGNPYYRCRKNCTTAADCIYTDVCQHNKCMHGCESLKCLEGSFCRSEKHRARCHLIPT